MKAKQLPLDKVKHFMAGVFIAVVLGYVVGLWLDPLSAAMSGLAGAILIGTAKEAVYDNWLKRGTDDKLAGTFKTNDFAVSFNGGSVSTDTSGAMDYSSVSFGIGSRIGGANTLNGHIKKIAYYPKALSASELEALTS